MNKFVVLAIVLVFCGLGILITQLIVTLNTRYQFENQIGCYWELADRSSTLAEKSKYIDQYINALKECKHSEYNAIIYKTKQNSFEYNLKALQSLSDRLNKIKDLDENSFAYQSAIQQITAQEQGEANRMNEVFISCYFQSNAWICYNAYAILLGLFAFILLIAGIVIFFIYLEY
jgi:hypothetical protein